MKTLKTILAGVCLAAAATSCNHATEAEGGNAVIETIMARRSIRKYKAEPVDRETMNRILECGINAPSGMNKQSWEVRVVDDPAVMDQIKELIDAGELGEVYQVYVSFREHRDFSTAFRSENGKLHGRIAKRELLYKLIGSGSVFIAKDPRTLRDRFNNPHVQMLGMNFCVINEEE